MNCAKGGRGQETKVDNAGIRGGGEILRIRRELFFTVGSSRVGGNQARGLRMTERPMEWDELFQEEREDLNMGKLQRKDSALKKKTSSKGEMVLKNLGGLIYGRARKDRMSEEGIWWRKLK